MLRFHEPQTTTILATKQASGSAFSGHQLAVGNFVAGAASGFEVAIGMVFSSGAVTFKVIDETGTVLKTGSATGPGTFQPTLLTIGTGGATDQLLFGLVRGDGSAFHKVFDVTAAPTKVGGSFATLDATRQVVDWIVGDFNSSAGDGQEIVVGFTTVANGRIGFASWSRTGATKYVSVFAALPGDFINPQFLAMRPRTAFRDDVIIGAAHTTGKPRVDAWNGIAGTQLLTKRIFNEDVV
jgi:hypothetical protein